MFISIKNFYVKWGFGRSIYALCNVKFLSYVLYYRIAHTTNTYIPTCFYQNKLFLFKKLLRKFRFGIQSGKDGTALHASLPIHAICKLSRAYYGNDMHANGIIIGCLERVRTPPLGTLLFGSSSHRAESRMHEIWIGGTAYVVLWLQLFSIFQQGLDLSRVLWSSSARIKFNFSYWMANQSVRKFFLITAGKTHYQM